jgi:hypothetical protein
MQQLLQLGRGVAAVQVVAWVSFHDLGTSALQGGRLSPLLVSMVSRRPAAAVPEASSRTQQGSCHTQVQAAMATM